MANSIETGHAKNVANFEKLIVGVTAQGAAYNPANALLKSDALNSQLAAARAANEAVNSALSAFKQAVGTRSLVFDGLSKTVTRINNALKASGADGSVNQSAMTFVRKLQGRRASARMTPEEKQAAEAKGRTVVEISASQMGFDSRLDNLDKLLQLLASVKVYAPNEADLKIDALKQLYQNLKAGNTAVVNAQTRLTNARMERNEKLYHPSSGLTAVSTGVKQYVKSVFGTTSPQYQSISGLRFTTIS